MPLPDAVGSPSVKVEGKRSCCDWFRLPFQCGGCLDRRWSDYCANLSGQCSGQEDHKLAISSRHLTLYISIHLSICPSRSHASPFFLSPGLALPPPPPRNGQDNSPSIYLFFHPSVLSIYLSTSYLSIHPSSSLFLLFCVLSLSLSLSRPRYPPPFSLSPGRPGVRAPDTAHRRPGLVLRRRAGEVASRQRILVVQVRIEQPRPAVSPTPAGKHAYRSTCRNGCRLYQSSRPRTL